MSDIKFQKKLLETFKIEADEHLSLMASGLLQIEKNPTLDNSNILEVLHRESHSLKGAARAVDLLDIELICQAIEKIFSAWKRNELKMTHEFFDTLYHSFTVLQGIFLNIDKEPLSTDKKIIAETVAQLNNLLSVSDFTLTTEKILKTNEAISTNQLADYSSMIQTVRIASSKLDSLLLKTEELLIVKLVIQKYITELTEINETIKSWKTEWNKLLRGNSSQTVETFLASGFDRIKQLENTINTLHSEFDIFGRQFNSLIEGLSHDTKDIVMLPFSTLLDSFPMMVRNLSREQGKDINFVLNGTEIEIDKRILDELKDPLIHLVRNSIDHGIEKPADRTDKNVAGTIKMSISHFIGNKVEVIISDDGRGIDLNAVKKSAVKQGFLTPHDADTMTEQDILLLIYLSGVSTSPIITNVSGHGLGMAIVREKIEKIGGHIELTTKHKIGTEIKITLPLSFSTFRGVLIKAANQSFILPTVYLERIIRIQQEDIKTIENKDTIVLDSMTLSLVKLHDVLGISVNSEYTETKKYFPVAIINVGENRAALQLDEVYGTQELLVKKLYKPLIRVRYIAAATILETGVPVPILNTNDLIKSVMKGALPQRSNTINMSEKFIENKTILVAEDSMTTRLLLKSILEMAGYIVNTAVDGADAWRILKEKEHDIALVVSDVEMPRMTGLELVKKIRNDKKLAEIPVILVTTFDKPEDREGGIDAGANAYIVKSNFNDANLVALVKRLL